MEQERIAILKNELRDLLSRLQSHQSSQRTIQEVTEWLREGERRTNFVKEEDLLNIVDRIKKEEDINDGYPWNIYGAADPPTNQTTISSTDIKTEPMQEDEDFRKENDFQKENDFRRENDFQEEDEEDEEEEEEDLPEYDDHEMRSAPQSPADPIKSLNISLHVVDIWPPEEFSTVLIMGDDYVVHGEERARSTLGTNLGVQAEIEWLGTSGMRWESVVPKFMEWLRYRLAPHMLLIHCGANDLGKERSVHLASAIQRDLTYLRQRFPKMVIGLSAMTQRRYWGGIRPKKMERARKWVNWELAEFLSEMNGVFVRHDGIRHYKADQFGSDQVQLSSSANDIFLSSFAQVLRLVCPWD